MRLVSRSGPLERKVYTMEGGREAELLDVVQAQAVGPRPVTNQPENYLAAGPRPGILGAILDAVFGSKRWKTAGRVETANAPPVLDPLIRKGPDLLGNQRDREDLPAFENRSAINSLTLIEPDSMVWEVMTSFRGQRNERQLRARFILDGAEYSLLVTDPRWEERCSLLNYGTYDNSALQVQETDRILLTVSLEEPYFGNNPSGECFKSVAGVILLPGTKKGETPGQSC